jgi:hypothetical protein
MAVTAKGGRVEFPLPASYIPNSLRVKPKGGSVVAVDIVPGRRDPRQEAERARIQERLERLNDRLQALEAKEEIFRAAAKAQGGKSPRKTKTNREPMEEIRKGTGFAIGQLEGVYAGRRQAKKEQQELSARLKKLDESSAGGGGTARLRLAARGGRAVVSWLQSAPAWRPSYDFRLENNGGEAILYAVTPAIEREFSLFVSPASFREAAVSDSAAAAGDRTVLLSFPFRPEEERYHPLPQPEISFRLRNTSSVALPPGEANCYRSGTFMGKAEFPGSPPGEVRELVFGAAGAGSTR